MTNRLQKIEKAINNMSNDKFNELLNDLGVKEEKQWVPEYREWYWGTMATGEVRESHWENDVVDNYRLLMNNVFKTEEEAEAQRDFNIEKAKLIKEIKDSSDVINWDNSYQTKFYIYLTHHNKDLRIGAREYTQSEGTTFTTNRVFLENLIKNEPELS